MSKAICVFSSSSAIVAPIYFEATKQLGAMMAQHDYTLVYGGANIGLMGALATAVKEHGGKVVGVIPAVMQGTPIVFAAADEMVVTKDMRARKEAMEARADAFITLPGGFGTLEETMEILTFKQLQFHSKPVILLNTKGFFNHLAAHFEHMFEERFASSDHHRQLYHLAEDVPAIFSYLNRYQPAQFPIKWF